MAEISVARLQASKETASFEVAVAEGGSETTHRVTISQGDLDRWSASDESPEQFVRRCFEFLLQREPRESIMNEFDVSIISRYFPEFEREISR